MSYYTPDEAAILLKEDAQFAATEKAWEAERRYLGLITELEAMEKSTGLYLTDMNIDAENVDKSLAFGSAEYFGSLYAGAGMRAEEAGFDINAALGRIIY